MDLLLDVDIVLDVCLSRPGSAAPARDAIALCGHNGGRVWIYAGAVQTLHYALINELKDYYSQRGISASNRQLIVRAQELLREFCADKQWLAALAGEGDVFAGEDPENQQLVRALKRFEPGDIALLTRGERLADRTELCILSPEQYLRNAGDNNSVDLIDLKAQQDAIRAHLEQGIHRVLHHCRFIFGPEVSALEDKLAAYTGAAHCITVASGTEALLIALMALDIGPGDEVITTPFTFIATAETIALRGAKPVFVDILPRTYNLDPARIEMAITPQTRAIMPAGLYGQCAAMGAINAIAERHHLPVIEDAAQSFGASQHGRRSGGLSTIGATSFFPSKPLGGYGDGGALFTNDDALAKAMREIRVHGQDRRYHHCRIGVNGRFDNLQAAVLLAKLERFDGEVEQRQAIGAYYTQRLATDCPAQSCCRHNRGAEPACENAITVPWISPGNTSVYAQYTIAVADRNAVAERLNGQGIATTVHYPVPLHRQPAFAAYGYREGDFPVAEAAAQRVLSLPMDPNLSREKQDRVIAALRASPL